MKKKFVSILLSASMLTSISPIFASDSTLYNRDYLISNGIIIGDNSGYNFDKPITRAELTKIIIEVLKPEEKSDLLFADVDNSHWAYDYICLGIAAGFINGYEDGTFRPDDNVKYEEALKMIESALMQSSYLSYPLGYISEGIDKGYLTKINFIVGDDAVRGDVFDILCNVLNYKEEKQAELSNDKNNNNSYQYATSGSAPSSVAPGSISGGGGGGSANGSSNSSGGGTAGIVEGSSSDYYIGGYPIYNTEEYSSSGENIYKKAILNPLSTFSIDVDTASYSNMRRFLVTGNRPTDGAVRVEELINYFDYNYPLPEDGTPFSVNMQTGYCPWNEDAKLFMVGLKGQELLEKQPSNIVLLIDISGSMYSDNKLPLVKKSLKMLCEQLDENDKVSIVTYASGTNTVLDGANGNDYDAISAAIDSLYAGGSTAGAAGINLAYEAAKNNIVVGNNRVIICTDGDFNVGQSSEAELEKLISDKKDSGIFLSVMGFGMGNYKDNKMEILADKGNGNYAYIDNLKEAQKVFVNDMTKTLFTIAKDVKIQVEFNPEVVSEYRLVGYENRLLENEDFENDQKDAGELGSGHTVTAFYEIKLNEDTVSESGLKYTDISTTGSEDMATVCLRYKEPNGDESKLVEYPYVMDDSKNNEDFKFASSVAYLGMILNNSEFIIEKDYDKIIEMATESLGEDKWGYRREFIQLAGIAKFLDK